MPTDVNPLFVTPIGSPRRRLLPLRGAAPVALLAVMLAAGGCAAKDRVTTTPGGTSVSSPPTTCAPRATQPVADEPTVSSALPPSTEVGAGASSGLVGHPARAGGGSGGGRSGGADGSAKTGGGRTGGSKTGGKDRTGTGGDSDDAPDRPTTVPRPTTTTDPCR